MLFSALPRAQGLYDPQHESDSCGVAMIADIQGRRSHAIVADGLVALEHLEHRGAAGAETNSGDGAGILHPTARRAASRRRRLRTATIDRRTAAIRSRPESAFFRRRRSSGRPRASRSRPSPPTRGSTSSAGASCPSIPTAPTSARRRAAACRTCRSCSSRRPTRVGGIDLDRRVYPLRKRAEAGDVYFPSLSSRTIAYKGMLDDNAAAAVLSGPAGRALHERDRHRAQQVLHQHLPVMATGTPVPLRRPQRRDQHRSRQPKPHARPRGDAGQHAHPR